MSENSYRHFWKLVLKDSFRYNGDKSLNGVIRNYLDYPSFRFTFWLRHCEFFRSHKILRIPFYYYSILQWKHLRVKFSIQINPTTVIGAGFYILHWGGIVIHKDAIIGKNCTIAQGVTIGETKRGKRCGIPEIGNNVYIGPGSKIIGKIKIGNNVAIGANCVVTKDIPDYAVVVGVPGRVINYEGSLGYVEKTMEEI